MLTCSKSTVSRVSCVLHNTDILVAIGLNQVNWCYGLFTALPCYNWVKNDARILSNELWHSNINMWWRAKSWGPAGGLYKHLSNPSLEVVWQAAAYQINELPSVSGPWLKVGLNLTCHAPMPGSPLVGLKAARGCRYKSFWHPLKEEVPSLTLITSL